MNCYFVDKKDYFYTNSKNILYNNNLLNDVKQNNLKVCFIWPIGSAFFNANSLFIPLNIYQKNTEYFNDFINDFKFDYIVIKKEILNGDDIINDSIEKYDRDYIYGCEKMSDPEYVTHQYLCLTSQLLKLIKENFEITATEDENIYKVVRKNNTSKKTE